MLRRLALIIASFSFVIIPLIFAPEIRAWTLGEPINNPDDFNAAMDQNSADKALQDFCAKRQGGQMNLETWYSGKCPDAAKGDTFNSYSGEGVGFADIVILDLLERTTGEKDPKKTIWIKINDALETLTKLSQSNNNSNQSANNLSYQDQISLNAIRQELFSGQDSGLLGQSGKMITMLFENQPASTRSYLAYISNNLQQHKIIQPALAANGIGFTTLSPFITIWIAFRNLAYLGLVVFFIVYGFMMMFRVNLGQKTVISVQLAIPKLIVTLLVITFSFAIVGLIYDLMWVVITFIFDYFQSQGIIVSMLGPKVASGQYGLIPSGILNSLIAGPAAIFGIVNIIFGGVGAVIGTVASLFAGIGIIISIIIIIAVIIAYAKLFYKLITAFISVVISLITAPIVLLGNALPGSNAIGNWIRGIVANLSVFPITMLLLFFSYLLMIQPILSICGGIAKFIPFASGKCELAFGVKQLAPIEGGIYNIPIISTPILGMNVAGLLALLGVGLLLMASKYVDMVKDALKVPAFKYGTDIMKALESGVTGNEAWAKKGYAGLPGPLRTNSKLTGAHDIYGGADAEKNPVIRGTGINLPNALKQLKGSSKE